jgi:hypothetical protein
MQITLIGKTSMSDQNCNLPDTTSKTGNSGCPYMKMDENNYWAKSSPTSQGYSIGFCPMEEPVQILEQLTITKLS